MARLTVKRPKPRVIEKLLELGLIQDRKELRKKRARKPGSSSKSRKSRGQDEDESSNESGKCTISQFLLTRGEGDRGVGLSLI